MIIPIRITSVNLYNVILYNESNCKKELNNYNFLRVVIFHGKRSARDHLIYSIDRCWSVCLSIIR